MSDSPLAAHQMKASGAGWVCTCGAWGWTMGQFDNHIKSVLRDGSRTWAEKAIDEAWERNR